jgi:hypothetical protein
MLLYHMTSASSCLKILKARKLKVSLFDDLNDPFELLAISTGEKMARILLKHMKKELTKKNGLLCFSSTWQEPLLWAHYGEKHKGVCLGFEIADRLPQKVKYVSERLQHKFSTETSPISSKAAALIRESLFTKHDGWKYEKEWRIFTDLAEQANDGRYYAPFSDELILKEIIVGDRCALTLSSIAKLLDRNAPQVTIRAARAAFTSFSVITQNAVTPKRVGI